MDISEVKFYMMLQGYINLLLKFVMMTAILYLPIFFILKKKGKGFIRQLSYLLCFLSLFLVIFATIILFNLPIDFKPEQYTLNLEPFRWLKEANIKQRIMVEISPNIILFIPLGFFIPTVFKKGRELYKTAFLVFMVTISIESFQYLIGRSSDVDDVIANLVGGIIGYGIFELFNFLCKDKDWWRCFLGEKANNL